MHVYNAAARAEDPAGKGKLVIVLGGFRNLVQGIGNSNQSVIPLGVDKVRRNLDRVGARV
jgi:hypothetical protein